MLTLFNEYGESYTSDVVTTYTKTNSKVKMRWACATLPTNKSPFTHAMLHSERKVLTVSHIRGFDPGIDPKEIEMEFAL